MANTPIVGGIGFEIRAEDERFIRELRRAAQRGKKEMQGVATSADKVGDELAEAGRKGDQAMSKVARQANRAGDALGRAKRNADLLRNSVSGLAIGAGLVLAGKVVAEFGQAMSTVKAITEATSTQFEALRDKAKELGATTRFTATQAAEGMIFLARAGFDTDEVLGSVEGTLQLAQSGALDLGAAADIASNALQGMRLNVDQTGRVVDVLSATANSTNTNVRQLGDAMKYVAPISAGLNVTVEETAAAIGALSNAGLQGELAGTGLRRVMIGLEKQSRQGQKILAKYGLTIKDVSVQANGGLTPALQKLAAAGVSTAESMTLFGLRGGPAFEVLMSSVGDIERLSAELDNAGGTADRIATIMDDNLNGTLLRTRSRLEALIIALADAGAEDALIDALEGLNVLLIIAAENADILTAAIVALSVRALIPLAAAIVGRASVALVALGAQLSLITFKAGAAAAAMTGMGAAVSAIGGPVTIAIAAAAVAFVAMAREANSAERAIDDATDTFSKYQDVLLDIESDTKDLETANGRLTQAIESQGDAAQRTAALEVDAIRRRLAANKELAGQYRRQIIARLADAEAAVVQPSTVRYRQALQVLRESGITDPADLAEGQDARIDQAATVIELKISNGEEISDVEREILDLSIAADESRKEIESLRDALAALDGPTGNGLGEDMRSLLDPYRAEIEAEQKRVEDFEKKIAQARAEGREGLVKAFEEQKRVALEVIRLLEGGNVTPEFARLLAEENIDQPEKKKAKTDNKVEKDPFAPPLSSKRDNQLPGTSKLEKLRTELAIQAALRAGDEERATLLQKGLDIQDLALKLYRDGVPAIDAYGEARSEIEAEYEKVLSNQRQELLEITKARDLDIALQVAQLQGDEARVEELEKQLDLAQRISQLQSEGFDPEAARTRALEEQAKLEEGQLSKLQEARSRFTEGLSGDISTALSNAVRSGDWGAVFGEILGSTAQRALEDSIQNLADDIANLFGNIFFGNGDAISGLLGNLGGGLGQTPGTVDSATAEAAKKGLQDVAGGATEAGGILSGVLGAASATQAVTAQTVSASLGTLAAAATAAAATLAQVAASSAANGASSIVSSILPGGGPRAAGGSVFPGRLYEVGENNLAEMLTVGTRRFLIPGEFGRVTPLANTKMEANRSTQTQRLEVFVSGTGNEEVLQMVKQGVGEAVRLAGRQAAVRVSDFQERKA